MMNRDSLAALLARPGVLAAALVGLVALGYLPWLGHTDLVNEETRRAVIARTMMQNGEYLVPYLAERIYLSKPPLFNWLIVLASAPAGEINPFTARLPTVISFALLALLMVFTAGRRLGTAARWLLGLAVIVTGELMHKAVIGTMDITFTLLVSASLWLWFELDDRGRRGLLLWLPPAILVAAAFLTKREPALVFYYLGIGGFLLTQRRFLELFRPPHLVAAAVTLGLIGLWLGPMIYRAGLEEIAANMQRQVLSRGLTPDIADYVTHFLAYPLQILVAALPASPLLLALAWRPVRRAVRARHGRMFVFATVVVLINLPIYWLRADAAVRYFLPMFPTLLVICALVFDTLVRDPEAWPRAARRVQYGVAAFLLALAALLAGAMVVLSVPGAFPEVAGPIMPWPLMLLLGAASLAAMTYAVLRFRRELAVTLFVAIVAFGVNLRAAEIGFRIPYEARRIVAEHDDVPALLDRLRAELPPGVEQVQGIGTIPHALWYYDRSGLIVPEARYERQGRLASPYLLVWVHRRERLEQYDFETEKVAEIRYEDGNLILYRTPAAADE